MSDKSTMVVCLDDLVGETHYWAKQSAWSLEEHDKQIKADAIEEVIKLYEEFQPKLATNVYEFGERLKQMQRGE